MRGRCTGDAHLEDVGRAAVVDELERQIRPAVLGDGLAAAQVGACEEAETAVGRRHQHEVAQRVGGGGEQRGGGLGHLNLERAPRQGRVGGVGGLSLGGSHLECGEAQVTCKRCVPCAAAAWEAVVATQATCA